MSDTEKIPYFDITGQFANYKSQWFREIEELGKTGNFILGNAIGNFEASVADFLGVKHAVTVSSGTDALVLALRGVGVGQGDSVIVPDFTFFATVEAVSLVGATPVFVDIDPVDFNICLKNIESAIDDRTKAVIPVDLFGAPADIAGICELARNNGISVIEDAAQAFGAKIGESYTGSLGDVGCFSFYPTKVLGAFGDGGLITTNSDSVAEKLHLLRNHGFSGANIHSLIGYTSRLDCVQVSLLQIKLESIKQKIDRRYEIANHYIDQLHGLGLELPLGRTGTRHVYNIFTIRSSLRDDIARALKAKDIGYQIYYPLPVHKQQPYMDLNYADEDFPESMRAAAEVISLPLYPEMPSAHVERICSVIRDVVG